MKPKSDTPALLALLHHIREVLEDAAAVLDQRDALLARPWMLVASRRGVELPWELKVAVERCRRAECLLEDALELLHLTPSQLPDELLELLIAVERRFFPAPDPRAFPARGAGGVTLGEVESACRAAGRAFSKDLPIHGGSPPRGVFGSPPRGTEEEDRLYRNQNTDDAEG